MLVPGLVEAKRKNQKSIKTVKSKILVRTRASLRVGGFLTPKYRLAFIQLKQAFTKAPTYYHFEPDCHIRIETDAPEYAIGGVLS